MKQILSLLRENRFFIDNNLTEGDLPSSTENGVINLFPEVRRQTLLGFGGAFTESAAYNYSLLDAETKAAFIRAYFDSKNGIGYSFGRTHINSCDFSLGIYTYVADGDKTLNTFSIDREKRYTIPLLRDALAAADEGITLFASPWSPPAYMKENGSMIHGGRLLDEYKNVWAHYYARYIKAMAAEGVPISAVSIQNEPIARQTWESCCYSDEDEAVFLNDHLLPALDEEGLHDVKVIVWDHNKERVYDRGRYILEHTADHSRILAVGHHWYSGCHFDGVRLVNEELHIPTVCTEFCCSSHEDTAAAAEMYAHEIIGNLDAGDIAVCDWNLLLDTNGGPLHNRSGKTADTGTGEVLEDKSIGCHAPVEYDKENGKLLLTPIYYAIGHFSKYIRRGAVRIGTTSFAVPVTAFRNPDGSLAAVALNASDKTFDIALRLHGTCTHAVLPPHSVSTFLL